jgi:hypothetical protein
MLDKVEERLFLSAGRRLRTCSVSVPVSYVLAPPPAAGGLVHFAAECLMNAERRVSGLRLPTAGDPTRTLLRPTHKSIIGGMKLLVATALLIPLLFCGGCSRHIDVIVTRLSPDGAITAASNSNSGEFPFEPQYSEVRLYPRNGRLREGQVILSFGEDESSPTFRWVSAQSLRVQLPCGWWSQLTNHYQLPRTSRIIEISYDPPPSNCSKMMTSSTAVPLSQR